MQRIAAAVMMPSGVPPMPASRSVPEFGRHAEIAPATSPSEMSRHPGACFADVGDQLLVPGPVEDAHGHVGYRQVLGLGDLADVLADRGGDVDRRRRRRVQRRSCSCRTPPTGRTSRRVPRRRAPRWRWAGPCSSASCRRSGRRRSRTPGRRRCRPPRRCRASARCPSRLRRSPRRRAWIPS